MTDSAITVLQRAIREVYHNSIVSEVINSPHRYGLGPQDSLYNKFWRDELSGKRTPFFLSECLKWAIERCKDDRLKSITPIPSAFVPNLGEEACVFFTWAGPVIIIDYGLYIRLGAFTTLSIATLHYLFFNNLKEAQECTKELSLILAEAAFAQALPRSKSHIDRMLYLVGDIPKPGTVNSHFLQIVFVLLHEYSHLVLKHNESAARHTLKSKHDIVAFYERSRKQEREADELAYKFIFEAVGNEESTVVPLALLFGALDKIEKLRKSEGNYIISPTHPPAKDRIEILLANIIDANALHSAQVTQELFDILRIPDRNELLNLMKAFR